jgi:WXG100 family type VII secretion target
MTEPINVDVDAMQNAVTEFEDKHDSIRGQVGSVQGEFEALSASWSGEAATGFQGAMHTFYEECNTILTSLQSLAKSVEDSAINYAKTHHLSTETAMALQKRINATPAGLPGF